MKDYTVIVTEIKTVGVTATAPSAETALDMVRTLKKQTQILDNAPDAECETVYRVFEAKDENTDTPPCNGDCENCPFADDEDDEEYLIDEIC